MFRQERGTSCTPTRNTAYRQRILSVALVSALLLLLLPVLPAPAEEFAATNDWPQEILTKEGKVLVYQPQLESLEGDTLTGRAAISFTPIGGEPDLRGLLVRGEAPDRPGFPNLHS